MANKKTLKFPKNFYWGASTSSYQIEGGIVNDWSEWEKSEKRIKFLKNKKLNSKKFISGKASNSFEMFDKDLDCIKKLNLGAYRFSIEWSRIEPEKGVFDEKAIEYYRNVIKKLKNNNIEPFVTLYHWPVPLWFRDLGSWEKRKNIKYFLEYTEKLIKVFKNDVKFWITLNEPMVYSSHSYLDGKWPPNRKSIIKTFKVVNNLAKVHNEAYEIIKSINQKAQIGIAKQNIYFEAYKNRFWNKPFAKLLNYFWEDYFLEKIKNNQDFLGLNYYKHHRIKYGFLFKNKNKEKNDMGWEIYPEGIYYELIDLKKHNKPVCIFENGLADAKDKKRKDFIYNHLRYVHKAISEGVDVRGYFHWSLIDNFEWAEGFDAKFGLFEVDRKTYERKIRPSAEYYAEICRSNKLYIE